LDSREHQLLMPDLDLGDIAVSASVWLVEVGSKVTAGDRLLEVVAGGVTVDLPAPADGILSRVFVTEDDCLSPGQLLAIIAQAD
jgi:pyruvate/2-oxoglutarate dehydrogenase complex dihydrolipoamide acyltransferase (E2) component